MGVHQVLLRPQPGRHHHEFAQQASGGVGEVRRGERSPRVQQAQLSSKEMQSIFDPVVQHNVDLIQWQRIETRGKVEVLAMVGGFLQSPYMLRRMREAFGATTGITICPPNPESAIYQGAVALALNPNAVVSRICKRTYGFQGDPPFEKEIDPVELLLTKFNGMQLCRDRFMVLVKKGDVVVKERPVTALCKPFDKAQKGLPVCIFSCDDMLPPRYTIDKWMQQEGKIVMDISGDMKLDDRRSIELSLCFGGSSLEVKARACQLQC